MSLWRRLLIFRQAVIIPPSLMPFSVHITGESELIATIRELDALPVSVLISGTLEVEAVVAVLQAAYIIANLIGNMEVETTVHTPTAEAISAELISEFFASASITPLDALPMSAGVDGSLSIESNAFLASALSIAGIGESSATVSVRISLARKAALKDYAAMTLVEMADKTLSELEYIYMQ